jgi:hypothetical protein
MTVRVDVPDYFTSARAYELSLNLDANSSVPTFSGFHSVMSGRHYFHSFSESSSLLSRLYGREPLKNNGICMPKE